MILGPLALLVAAIFTGAALYVSLVEHPARLALDTRALLTGWKPAYKRGTLMQAPLAIVGFLLGVAAWWQTAHLTPLTILAGPPRAFSSPLEGRGPFCDSRAGAARASARPARQRGTGAPGEGYLRHPTRALTARFEPPRARAV